VLQLQLYPQGDFSWHHLWFIVYLYVYVLLLLPALLWWRRQAFGLRPGKWLYGLAAPLAINEMLLKPLFPETHNLTSDWYTFNHYLLLTAYGFLLASIPNVWEWLMIERRMALGLAAGLLALGLPLLDAGIIRRDTALDSLLANVFTWLSLMAFLGYGRRYLSFSNRLLEWARDASYPVYILHQTIIIAVGYWVIQQAWNPWVKYTVVLLTTMATCSLLYEFVIRRFAMTRLIFGMKLHSRMAPQPQATAESGSRGGS
jgi:glucans biosynthesis protein C